MTTSQTPSRPPIVLAENQADLLSDLAVAASAKHPKVSELLLEEIERADLVPEADLPANVVGMGSTVTFVVAGTEEKRTITLVYPQDADIEQDRLSILTPVGAGLLGLQVGQTISWPTRTGHERLLRIESVSRP